MECGARLGQVRSMTANGALLGPEILQCVPSVRLATACAMVVSRPIREDHWRVTTPMAGRAIGSQADLKV